MSRHVGARTARAGPCRGTGRGCALTPTAPGATPGTKRRLDRRVLGSRLPTRRQTHSSVRGSPAVSAPPPTPTAAEKDTSRIVRKQRETLTDEAESHFRRSVCLIKNNSSSRIKCVSHLKRTPHKVLLIHINYKLASSYLCDIILLLFAKPSFIRFFHKPP